MLKDKGNKHERGLAVISEGAALNGVLRSTAVIHLSGAFQGLIVAQNELIISPGGKVTARIHARKVVIAGDFQGEMAVREEIEIAETGRFAGTLYQQAPSLIVVKGGRFDGQSVFVDNLDEVALKWEPHSSSPAQDGQAPVKLHAIQI